MSDRLAEKARLRLLVRARVAALPAAERVKQAQRLSEQVRTLTPWRSAGAVLLFAPLADEPDLWPLVTETLAEGKLVTLPSFDAASGSYVARQIREVVTDVVVGRFGVREPRPECPVIAFAALDLVLVPGVAFDPVGNRLGRGKGFYDRLLTLTTDAVSCGVGFDEQVVSEVPVEPHDVKLHYVLTPSRCFTGRAGGG